MLPSCNTAIAQAVTAIAFIMITIAEVINGINGSLHLLLLNGLASEFEFHTDPANLLSAHIMTLLPVAEKRHPPLV